MLGKEIGILQANVGARPGPIMSIFNDTYTKTFDVLCISEPYIFPHPRTGGPTVNQHSGWRSVVPKNTNQGALSVRHAFRAAMWVSERVTYQEEETRSPDLAAITIQLQDAQLLLISVYTAHARQGTQAEAQRALDEHLDEIQRIIRDTKAKKEGQLHLYVGGDFNRHSNVWGGTPVQPDRAGEDWPILQLMLEEGLDSTLPRGTITFSHNNGSGQSTIDLVLISARLQANLIQCRISHTDHGGDHRVIESRFRIPWTTRQERAPRRAYDQADWGNIREKAA